MRKLENWLTYGGAALAVLAFLNVDASAVLKWMRGMDGRTAFALSGAIIFLIGFVLKLRDRKVRLGNVQRKIDGWLRASNFAFREISEWPKWHFGFQITEPGTRMWVARVKGTGRERYISLIAPIIPFSQVGKEAYDGAPPDKKDELHRKLMVQTAISKTNVTYKLEKNEAEIIKKIPITPSLIEVEFIAAVYDVWFSTQIIWNTITLELPQKEAVTPPAPISDKEAPPPPPTS